MNDNLNVISNQMKKLETSQDGTLTGGFVSVSGGRHRIILDEMPDTSAAARTFDNGGCGGSTNTGCTNQLCWLSHNTKGAYTDCYNGFCSTANPGSGYQNQIM